MRRKTHWLMILFVVGALVGAAAEKDVEHSVASPRIVGAKLRWQFNCPAGLSKAVVIGNERGEARHISGEKIVTGGGDGKLYLFACSTGELLKTTPLSAAPLSPPLSMVLEPYDKIVIGDAAGNFYGVAAARGEVLWQLKVAGKITGEATRIGNRYAGDQEGIKFLFGAYDGRIHCVNAAGERLWQSEVGGMINGALVATGNYDADQQRWISALIYGDCDGKLTFIDERTGEILQVINLGAPLPATPTFAFTGAGKPRQTLVIVNTHAGEVVAVNTATQAIVWRQDLSTTLMNSPCIMWLANFQREVIFIVGENGTLYKLSPVEGKILQKIELGKRLRTPLAVHQPPDDLLLLANSEGILTLLRAEDLSEVWRYDVQIGLTDSLNWTPDGFSVVDNDGNLFVFEWEYQ